MGPHRTRPGRVLGAWSVAAVVVAALAATTPPAAGSRGRAAAEVTGPTAISGASIVIASAPDTATDPAEVTGTTAPATAAAGRPLPDVAATAAPAVALYGPFGAFDGVPLGRGDPDPAGLRALDTYGRAPALLLQARDPQLLLGGWHVVALPVEGGDPVDLVAGVSEAGIETLAFTGPAAGDWWLRAELVIVPAGPATYAWRLVVPDRDLPAVDEPFPAPDVVLFGGGDTVVAVRGSGCYVGTCADIGAEPPDRTLPLIRLPRGDAPVVLTLSDGSGIAALTVEARPSTAGRPVRLEPITLAGDGHVVTLPSLPRPGTWRLEARVAYDLERGHGTAYARVELP